MSGNNTVRNKANNTTVAKARKLESKQTVSGVLRQVKIDSKLLESTKATINSFVTSTPKSAMTNHNHSNMNLSHIDLQTQIENDKRNYSQVDTNSSMDKPALHATFTKEELLDDIRQIVTQVVEDKLEQKLNDHISRLTFKSDIEGNRKRITKTEDNVEELKIKLEAEIQARQNLEDKFDKIDLYNRKDNLKMINVINDKERERPKETEIIVIQALEHAGIRLPSNAIVSARRLGTYQELYNRTILVSFLHKKDRDTVRNGWKALQVKCNVRVEDDFPEKIIKRRRILYPVMKHAQRNKHKANIHIDQLFIDGKKYTVNNLEELPPHLHLEKTITIEKDDMVVFFKSTSPLSNHHPCKFSYRDTEYNCSEQAYMRYKAISNNCHDIADKIMAESNPVKQKKLGDNIPEFDERQWNLMQKDTMKEILVAKFTECDRLKQFLLSTGDKELVEGNPNDQYWSCGLSIFDNDIWNKVKWTGQNQLGKILVEIRSEL